MQKISHLNKKFLSKKILRHLGSFLAFSGVFFIGIKLFEYSTQIDLSEFNIHTWLTIIALTILSSFSLLFLVKAWHSILAHLMIQISFFKALEIYGIAQLAKYVPGNFAHLAGRQTEGLAQNINGLALAKSIGYELALLVVSSSVFTTLTLSFFYSVNLYLTLIIFISTWALFQKTLNHFFSKKMASAFVYQTFFFFLSSMIFVLLLICVNTKKPIGLFEIQMGLGAFSVAWLIGFITPGAPAGLGIREITLLFFLKNFVGEGDLLLVLILSRIQTIGGDILFTLYSRLPAILERVSSKT